MTHAEKFLLEAAREMVRAARARKRAKRNHPRDHKLHERAEAIFVLSVNRLGNALKAFKFKP